MKKIELNQNEIELLFSIIDYIEDCEAEDFEDQCNEKQVAPQDLIFTDSCSELEHHIFFKACKLRYLLNLK